MAPRDSWPRKTTVTKWTLERAWKSPTCEITKKIIWPWHMAWRRRTDTGWDYLIYGTKDIWLTEDQYLITKLKGELDNV